MIEFVDIVKKFKDVIANDHITLNINSGEIHAIIGENGAGKSTLMKILAGFYKADYGTIKIGGKNVQFKSPSESQYCGIGMVHQQFSLIDKLTVLENVILGDKNIPVFYSKKKIFSKLIKIVEKVGLEINIESYVKDLSVSDKQIVEILRLLWKDYQILIFDEPFSQLSFMEIEKIIDLINTISKEKGKTVIIISHNIAEILRISDNISVLRNGELVKTLTSKLTNENEVARLMIGSEVDLNFRNKSNNDKNHQSLLQISNLETKINKSGNIAALNEVSLDIRKGEILGISGVKNNGQEDFMKVLHGNIKPVNGTFRVNGKNIKWSELNSMIKIISFIPVDSLNEGSAANLNLATNLLFKKIYNGEFNSSVFLKKRKIIEKASEMISEYDISPKQPNILAKNLSGGNLQKSIIAREFDDDWELMLAMNPLAGLDIKFSNWLLKKFQNYSKEKKRTILFLSNNIDQLFDTCDRIAVFNRGRIMGIVEKCDFTKEKVSLLMGGVNK